ncbi:anti-sigma factor [Rasiella rasia]|uniref:Anti-sigma factor n=1 Tax=Rasiella rasia TaxID=2744027 RepID=A0A6G6GI03_9FLAO|nr:anti-sigma factor [Rasiella rasia]QIE58147.1 anti-sigma factor [Rasiella rasia]
MTEEEIIESGKLELYVCGALPADEDVEIQEAVAASKVLQKEVEVIEASFITLAESVAPPLSAMVWTYILNTINKVTKLDRTDTSSTNWSAISGWAAAVVVLGGLFWMMNQNSTLEQDIELTTTENNKLEETLHNVEELQKINEGILADLRDDAFQKIPLPGNDAVAPEASAKMYYNATEGIAYLDADKLPAAPQGKVYQVWSLKMEPLTPSSMGLLEELTSVKPGLYKFENFTSAEGFGITLEPEGGSETPTLSQLYVLGTVGNTP